MGRVLIQTRFPDGTKEINTYPEMNKSIKELLGMGTQPMLLYALARIEELEAENAALLRGWQEQCEACGFNNANEEAQTGCAYPVCAAHQWRSRWWEPPTYEEDVRREEAEKIGDR